jgi:hypothetical protein
MNYKRQKVHLHSLLLQSVEAFGHLMRRPFPLRGKARAEKPQNGSPDE